MTRLDRIIQAFNEYDEIVEDFAWSNNDGSKDLVLEELRTKVSLLVGELKMHGCSNKWSKTEVKR